MRRRRIITNLRVVSQQDETFNHIHGLSSHGEHFGHEVAVTLEECDGAQLDVKEQRRHPSERLQVLLAFVRRGSNQRFQTLRFDGHLVHRKSIHIRQFNEINDALHQGFTKMHTGRRKLDALDALPWLCHVQLFVPHINLTAWPEVRAALLLYRHRKYSCCSSGGFQSLNREYPNCMWRSRLQILWERETSLWSAWSKYKMQINCLFWLLHPHLWKFCTNIGTNF